MEGVKALSGEKLIQRIEEFIIELGYDGSDITTHPERYESDAIRVAGEVMPQHKDRFKALIKTASHPIIAGAYEEFLYWCAIDGKIRVISQGRYHYAIIPEAAVKRDWLLANLLEASIKFMEFAREVAARLRDGPNQKSIREKESAIEIASQLTPDVLDDIQCKVGSEWAHHVLKWATEKYRQGDLEMGLCLVGLTANLREDDYRNNLFSICAHYLRQYPGTESLPQFQKICDYFYDNYCGDVNCPACETACDFVVLMCDPPNISAGAKELFGDLVKHFK